MTNDMVYYCDYGATHNSPQLKIDKTLKLYCLVLEKLNKVFIIGFDKSIGYPYVLVLFYPLY